jgi:hypothetical protein
MLDVQEKMVMKNADNSKGKSFTAFRSAAEEADTKRENDAMKREEQAWDNEGGHMSSTAGRVTCVSGVALPYVATLFHHGSESTERGFATMREAEAYVRRNTPVPAAILSTTYDRPPSEPRAFPIGTESSMNDEDILARLKVIDRRLREISTEDAASVLAGGIANAGLNEHERLRLVAETERILDELDGKDDH